MVVVVLPAYNEAPSIGTLLEMIKATLERTGRRYKVIVVNDGSSDATRGEIARFEQQMPIEVMDHRLNRGLWETVRDGFERAADITRPNDVIVRMDADDTHDPGYIPALIEKLESG